MTLIISAFGKKLKPILTCKGKTPRCLKSFDLTDNIIESYSNNGWANNGITKIALDEIYNVSKCKKAYLLSDQFSSHRSDFIIDEAMKRNTNLIFVPIGSTYKYQSLDVSINGILKQKAKAPRRKEIIKNPDMKILNKDAIRHFWIAFNEITSKMIKQSTICV